MLRQLRCSFISGLRVCRSERSDAGSAAPAGGSRSRCAAEIFFAFESFVSKGYTLAEAAPLLFGVTSGRVGELADHIAGEEGEGEVHQLRCSAQAGWRSLSRRKRSRGTTSGTWSKVRHHFSSLRFVRRRRRRGRGGAGVTPCNNGSTILGFWDKWIDAGGGGWRGGRRLSSTVKHITCTSATHCEDCACLPALHLCSLLLPIILILPVVLPRIVLLSD